MLPFLDSISTSTDLIIYLYVQYVLLTCVYIKYP